MVTTGPGVELYAAAAVVVFLALLSLTFLATAFILLTAMVVRRLRTREPAPRRAPNAPVAPRIPEYDPDDEDYAPTEMITNWAGERDRLIASLDDDEDATVMMTMDDIPAGDYAFGSD